MKLLARGLCLAILTAGVHVYALRPRIETLQVPYARIQAAGPQAPDGSISGEPGPAAGEISAQDPGGRGPAVAPAMAIAEPSAKELAPSAAAIGTGLFYVIPGGAGTASFRDHADRIGVIAPQCFSLDRWGRLRGSLPDDLLAIARDHRVQIMPLVINSGFSRYNAEHLLRNAGARDRAVGALVEQGRALGLAGWQIDFENLPSFERAALTRFVAEAAGALHRHGMQLSVAVAARTSDDPHNESFRTFSGVYDYAALARSADFLSVMAYPESDAHHPGPLASYPWVEQVVRHVLLQVPADKISLGLPTYQSDWVERRVRISIRRRIEGKIKRVFRYIYRLFHHNGPVTVDSDNLKWDPVLKASYRIEGRGHSRHITWVEDERSFAAKLQLVVRYHLRGYSVWRIGLEDPHIWAELPLTGVEQAAAASTPLISVPRLSDHSLTPAESHQP